MEQDEGMRQAERQARYHYQALAALVERLNRGDATAEQEATDYPLGAEHKGRRYTIVLAIGGPAVRVTGEWGDGEPLSASLQYQNRLTSWEDYDANDPSKQETVLLRFARHCLT